MWISVPGPFSTHLPDWPLACSAVGSSCLQKCHVCAVVPNVFLRSDLRAQQVRPLLHLPAPVTCPGYPGLSQTVHVVNWVPSTSGKSLKSLWCATSQDTKWAIDAMLSLWGVDCKQTSFSQSGVYQLPTANPLTRATSRQLAVSGFCKLPTWQFLRKRPAESYKPEKNVYLFFVSWSCSWMFFNPHITAAHSTGFCSSQTCSGASLAAVVISSNLPSTSTPQFHHSVASSVAWHSNKLTIFNFVKSFIFLVRRLQPASL